MRVRGHGGRTAERQGRCWLQLQRAGEVTKWLGLPSSCGNQVGSSQSAGRPLKEDNRVPESGLQGPDVACCVLGRSRDSARWCRIIDHLLTLHSMHWALATARPARTTSATRQRVREAMLLGQKEGQQQIVG